MTDRTPHPEQPAEGSDDPEYTEMRDRDVKAAEADGEPEDTPSPG